MYIISNIKFREDALPISMKLIKICGGFNCSADEAKHILQQIEAGESIDVQTRIDNNLCCYGITCDIISYEALALKHAREAAELAEQQQITADTILANNWFEQLSTTEKYYVNLLGRRHYLMVG